MKFTKKSLSSASPRGFSLVLSLTVMAMLLLICIGAASLLSVELRVGRASASVTKARLNALVGARIACGEIQRLAGPDQRVSATGEILCDPARTDPTQTNYYTSPDIGGTVVHPRWVGIWNSGGGSNPGNVSGAAATEVGKVVQRVQSVGPNSAGYLMDSRFTQAGNHWNKTRASGSPGSNPARLLGWLVSGNEALPAQSGSFLSPFTAFDSNKDTTLLGLGTLKETRLFSPGGAVDLLGARARMVGIPTSAGETTGRYAYWVSDEGVKARINLKDNFEGKVPTPGSPEDGGYFRHMLPQRNDFLFVRNAVDTGNEVNWSDMSAVVSNPTRMNQLAAATGFSDLSLLNPSWDADKVRQYYCHDITFASSGVLSDTLRGGLRRDLTTYLNSGAVAPASGAGYTDPGIKDADPILDSSFLAGISPKFGQLRSWAPVASPAITDGSVKVRYPANYLPNSGGTTPFQIPGYNNTEGSSFPSPLAPVMTYFGYHYQAGYQGTEMKLLLYPRVVLWNPYNVPLDVGTLRVSLRTLDVIRVNVRWLPTGANVTMPSPAVQEPRRVEYQWPATSGAPLEFSLSGIIKPGEALCYIPQGTRPTFIENGLNPLVPGDPGSDFTRCFVCKFKDNPNDKRTTTDDPTKTPYDPVGDRSAAPYIGTILADTVNTRVRYGYDGTWPVNNKGLTQ